MATMKLPQALISRFGLPHSLRLNSDLAFTANISPNLAKVLNVKWKLHCACQLKSSGHVERKNRTYKKTLTVLETNENWTNLPSFALLGAKYNEY